ncbi:MAG: hypothetical protein WKF59_05120 [Chitinophagaceae bacterium]
MKISYNWLREYLEEIPEPEKLSSILTSVGLEVEGVEKFEEFKGNLEGLVIGEVIECKKHPDADKLKLTKVNIGDGEPLQIVCGAPKCCCRSKGSSGSCWHYIVSFEWRTNDDENSKDP